MWNELRLSGAESEFMKMPNNGFWEGPKSGLCWNNTTQHWASSLLVEDAVQSLTWLILTRLYHQTWYPRISCLQFCHQLFLPLSPCKSHGQQQTHSIFSSHNASGGHEQPCCPGYFILLTTWHYDDVPQDIPENYFQPENMFWELFPKLLIIQLLLGPSYNMAGGR